jgi:hypothetical protein
MNWCSRSLALLEKITAGIRGHVEYDKIFTVISIPWILPEAYLLRKEGITMENHQFHLSEFSPSSDPT